MPTMHETELSVKQVKVTNGHGVDVAYGEIVFADGYLGTVADYDGIADAADGYININPDRLIQTDQVDTADLPAVGDIVYFHNADQVVQATGGVGTVFAGRCTGVSAVSGSEYIEFKPGYQNGNLVLS